MFNSKVSIIIPCYKTEKYLDRCVKSVIEQTLIDWELILVDDESPDCIPQMCDDWAKRDDRIKVIHKRNAGLGMACNSGLEIATGEYVAFLDSDDWVDAAMYQTMYNAAEKHKAQIVFTGLKRVNDAGVLMFYHHPLELKSYEGKKEINTLMLDMIAPKPSDPIERQISMSAKVVLYNRQHLKDNRIIFESERHFVSEDLLFNLDALSCTQKAVILPNCFYNYYINETSITLSPNLDKLPKFEILYDELRVRYISTMLVPETYKNRVDRFIIGYLRSYMKTIVSLKELPFSRKIALLKSISNSHVWKPIFSRYPIRTMPLSHRIILEFTRYRFALGLYLLFVSYFKFAKMRF
jgi:glycosyltransferase involved in cell wall biosynthesis